MAEDMEEWKRNMGFSNASNSPPPTDNAARSVWEYNTRQAAQHDSSNIPPGYYDGVPINMPTYTSGGGGAARWSELSDSQRRDAIISYVIAGLFAVGLWLVENKPMTSIWDLVALIIVSLIVCAFSYLILRVISNLLGLFRKIRK